MKLNLSLYGSPYAKGQTNSSLKWARPSRRYPSSKSGILDIPLPLLSPWEFFKDRVRRKGKLQIADGMPEGGLLVVGGTKNEPRPACA